VVTRLEFRLKSDIHSVVDCRLRCSTDERCAKSAVKGPKLREADARGATDRRSLVTK